MFQLSCVLAAFCLRFHCFIIIFEVVMIVLEDKSFYALDLILTITQIIILVIHEILGIKCMTLFTYSKEIKILKKGDYSRE